MGLSSHGHWAVANLATYTVSVPGSQASAPNTALLAPGTLDVRGSGGTSCLPSGPSPHPAPQQSQITPMLQGPAFRALHGPTIGLLLSVRIGLKILRTKIASPCRGKPGLRKHSFLVYHSSAAHHPRQPMQLLTPVSSLTCSLTH